MTIYDSYIYAFSACRKAGKAIKPSASYGSFGCDVLKDGAVCNSGICPRLKRNIPKDN